MAVTVKDLMAAAGMTPIAESFSGRGSVERPVKKFNAERYFAAKESIARVEAGFKGEVYELQAQIKAWAAAGEGLDDIKKKISNGATDAWRKTKELIGRLIIMIEELIAGLVSKEGGLNKMATRLQRTRSDIQSLVDSKPKVETPFSCELPLIPGKHGEKINNTITGKYDSKGKVIPGVTGNGTFRAPAVGLDYLDVMTVAGVAAGHIKDMEAFIDAVCNKDLYNSIRTDARALRTSANQSSNPRPANPNANPNRRQTPAFGTVNSTSRYNTVSRLTQLVQVVDTTAAMTDGLKAKIKAFKKGNIAVHTYNVRNAAQLLSFLNDLSKLQYIYYEAAKDAIALSKFFNSNIKNAKMMLNKIKNAPIKTTGTGKANNETLQLIRVYCTRAAKGLNNVRSYTNASMAYITVKCAKIVKAQEKTLKYVTRGGSNDDDLVKVQPYGKNTYK